MSFDSPSLRTDLVANGGVDYDIDFHIYKSQDVAVLVEGVQQIQGVHYVVRIVGGGAPFESLPDSSLPALATIRFITAPANGLSISAIPLQPLEQLSRYSTENLPVKRIEKDFDKSWFGIRVVLEKLRRIPSFAIGSILRDVIIDATPEEGKVLGWASDARLINMDRGIQGLQGIQGEQGIPGAGAAPLIRHVGGATIVTSPTVIEFDEADGFTVTESAPGVAQINHEPPVIPQVIPIGSIFATILVAAPTGFLLCDGAAVSRTVYEALFTLIGIGYGAGDGTTTFNLPNLKGRVPVGLDIAQTEFDALGEVGGAKTHVLTTAQMPVHRHALNMVSTTPLSNSGGNPGIQPTGALETADAGSGEAHNNLQPYLVLNYIIKT